MLNCQRQIVACSSHRVKVRRIHFLGDAIGARQLAKQIQVAARKIVRVQSAQHKISTIIKYICVYVIKNR